jgi:hypothetical protein
VTAANKQAPRPAATILLLREQASAPEVFMLQRTSKAAFLPGAFVFPGGALDPDDASERAARACAAWTMRRRARMGSPPAASPIWSPRAPKCFEESGSPGFDAKIADDPRRAENLEPSGTN